jgi:hypothetical protein
MTPILKTMAQVQSEVSISSLDDAKREERTLLFVGIAKTLFIVCLAIGLGVGLGVSIGYPIPYNGITSWPDFYLDYETGKYGYVPRYTHSASMNGIIPPRLYGLGSPPL